jgi:hypothetical protein
MSHPHGLSVSDIVAIWRIPVGSVYRLASEHGWRRYHESRRVLYHPLDVSTTLAGRCSGDAATPPGAPVE